MSGGAVDFSVSGAFNDADEQQTGLKRVPIARISKGDKTAMHKESFDEYG